MKRPARLPAEMARACARLGVIPSRLVLYVQAGTQRLWLLERKCSRPCYGYGGTYEVGGVYRCSTSRMGLGEKMGSHQTPRGLHRVAEKVGGGWPVGAVFESRQMAGFTWAGKPGAPIVSRILRLEGMEPGLNQGGDVDSWRRCIYIHGVGDELTLGRPASIGCIHLAAEHLLPLYDKVSASTLVWIAQR